MREIQQEEREKKGITAKALSKSLKILCAVGIIFTALAKWRGMLSNATVSEICLVWATVYGLGAGTIDLNIILDKFTGGK